MRERQRRRWAAAAARPALAAVALIQETRDLAPTFPLRPRPSRLECLIFMVVLLPVFCFLVRLHPHSRVPFVCVCVFSIPSCYFHVSCVSFSSPLCYTPVLMYNVYGEPALSTCLQPPRPHPAKESPKLRGNGGACEGGVPRRSVSRKSRSASWREAGGRTADGPRGRARVESVLRWLLIWFRSLSHMCCLYLLFADM